MGKTRYAYNASRQAFISLGVEVADTPQARLRGLLGRTKLRTDEAVWIVPSRGIHTIGLLFPIDVIYLDAEFRVTHLIENLRPLRIGPLRMNCASVLEAPPRTIESTGTKVGDLILVRSPEEICEYWATEQSGNPSWAEKKAV